MKKECQLKKKRGKSSNSHELKQREAERSPTHDSPKRSACRRQPPWVVVHDATKPRVTPISRDTPFQEMLVSKLLRDGMEKWSGLNNERSMCLCFQIQEVVYKELVVEFLATVFFKRKDGIYDKDNLTFCLGRERRALSQADFALRTEIYFPFKALISPNAHVYLPFLLVEFLVERVGKDKRGFPLYGGMLIMRLTHFFGVLDKCEALLLTVETHKPCSTLVYQRATIIGYHGVGGFSILDDTPCDQPRRRVRQRARGPVGDESPVVPTKDEMTMDPYSVVQRRFDDNLARSRNCTNMTQDYMMQQLHFSRRDHFPTLYPYVPRWEELWCE
ncbi:unnamed protein product [Lactuca saligna]|uniref:Uncharacterized protein n=1 Tax=Lactuca saligna TaxID=75948 RepID=A0AA35Z9G8_LACSI|nr:unnamed protein product [Lactuca saligna]